MKLSTKTIKLLTSVGIDKRHIEVSSDGWVEIMNSDLDVHYKDTGVQIAVDAMINDGEIEALVTGQSVQFRIA